MLTITNWIADPVKVEEVFNLVDSLARRQRTTHWLLRNELVHAQASHVDGGGFRFECDQQLVGIVLRSDASLK